MNTIAKTVLKTYSENFSNIPRLFFSPGRINLIGEHVDYNDGFVMPAAIDKGMYYAIAENQMDDIHFYSIDFEEHYSVNIHDIKSDGSWRNYVLSVVHEFLLAGKNISGFNCVFAGDIPIGSGMSSSAALEGGLAYALNDMFDIGLDRVELALLCQRAEHNYPNVQCGIMDQFANMNGKKDQVILLDCKSLAYEYFPLTLAGYKIILINSKVHHSLASGEYNVRRQRCEEGMRIIKTFLPVQSFRDIKTVKELDVAKDSMEPKVYNCCRFVVEEIARTQKAALLLQQGDMAAFGKLMFETHAGLSKLYEVSCIELDFLVEEARKFPAAIGARLMGGGFGGCTINIVAEDGVAAFIEDTCMEYQQQFEIVPEAYIVATADGTHEMILTP